MRAVWLALVVLLSGCASSSVEQCHAATIVHLGWSPALRTSSVVAALREEGYNVSSPGGGVLQGTLAFNETLKLFANVAPSANGTSVSLQASVTADRAHAHPVDWEPVFGPLVAKLDALGSNRTLGKVERLDTGACTNGA